MASTRISITVEPELVAEARDLGINISAAASKGVKSAIERERKIKEVFLE